MDHNSGTFTHFRHEPENPHSLSNNSVKSLYADRSGVFWVGTDSGLNRFDSINSRFTRYMPDPDDPGSLSHKQVEKIFEDHGGRLWVATYGGGLNLFSRDRGSFIRFKHDAEKPGSIGANVLFTSYLDRSGGIWAGTHGGGVSYFNQKVKKFSHYTSKMTDPTSLSTNKIRPLYEDRSGVLWVGTLNRGLNRLDKESGTFTRYRHDPDDQRSLSSDNIRAIHQDRSGQIWIATFGGGLNRFDPDTESFTRYQHDPNDPDSLSTNKVYSVFEDSSGLLLVGTWTRGLEVLDRKTGKFTHYPHDPGNPNSISHNSIVSFYEDREGVLWIGTYGGGLNRFDRKTRAFRRYQHDPVNPGSLSHNTVLSIREDRSGTLWFATGGGLNKLDRENERFSVYTTNDGLPSDIVHGVLEDSQGYLWLPTTRGISRFDPVKETFRNYDADDGLQGDQFDTGANTQGGDGVLYVGGPNGFNAFLPEVITDNPDVPPVVITNIQLANGPVQIAEDSVLQKSMLETDHLTLSYLDRVITFEFSALNYLSPQKNMYKYRLEGFEETWSQVNSSRRYATYTNLDPGEYIFRVTGSNNDGVWNEEGASIKVSVLPPWWETVWFKSITTMLLGGMIYLVFTWRIRDIKAQREQLKVLVAERTEELISSNKQLQQHAVVFQTSNEAIIITDANRRILQVNHTFSNITGFSEEEVIGQTPGLWRSNRHGDEFYSKIFSSLEHDGTWQGEIWNRRKNGEIFPVWESISVVNNDKGELSKYIAIFHDISERIIAEQRIRHLANHDALTDLPNRLLFNERSEHALLRAQRSGAKVALLFMDLDRFKAVNDSLGHHIGDALLQMAADRLRSQLRKEDTVARLGGDEFTILLENISQAEDVSQIAENIIETVRKPYKIEGNLVQIGISIGISVFPEHGIDVATLLDRADTTMYRAKESGRNRYLFYASQEAVSLTIGEK
ncbi:MAG: diguanylate cyclase [Candidatus Sedimenticola sp. 20ELBAFRAG]